MLKKINDNSGLMVLIATILLLVGNFLMSQAGGIDPLVEQGATNFDVLQVGDGSASETAVGFTADTDLGLYRSGANTLEIAAGGSSIVTVNTSGLTADSLTSSSGFTISDGNLVVADFIRATVQTTITVSATDTFTPTGTFTVLTASAWSTPTLSVNTTSFPTGTILVLLNGGTSNIHFADSGNYLLTAAFTMGQNDSITLVNRLGKWVELARANN